MTQSYVLMFLCKLPRVWIKCEMNERLQSENFSAGRRRRHQPPTPKITGGYLNLSPEVVRFLIFPMQWCDPSRISHTRTALDRGARRTCPKPACPCHHFQFSIIPLLQLAVTVTVYCKVVDVYGFLYRQSSLVLRYNLGQARELSKRRASAAFGGPILSPRVLISEGSLWNHESDARRSLRKEDAVQVVVLVLRDASRKPGQPQLTWRPMLVEAAKHAFDRAFHPPAHARHRQAALPHPVRGLTIRRVYLRVDPDAEWNRLLRQQGTEGCRRQCQSKRRVSTSQPEARRCRCRRIAPWPCAAL